MLVQLVLLLISVFFSLLPCECVCIACAHRCVGRCTCACVEARTIEVPSLSLCLIPAGWGPLTEPRALIVLLGWQPAKPHGSCCPHLPQSRGYRCVCVWDHICHLCAYWNLYCGPQDCTASSVIKPLSYLSSLQTSKSHILCVFLATSCSVL